MFWLQILAVLYSELQTWFYCFCRGIRQWVNVPNAEGHCGGQGGWSANIRLCHSFQVGRKLFFFFNFKAPIIKNPLSSPLSVFIGWKRGSQFTRQTWSSLRGSSFFTRRKCATCFTWSSSWTQIQTSGCLAEVSRSPFTHICDAACFHVSRNWKTSRLARKKQLSFTD